MELRIYKSLWGMPGSLEEQIRRIKKAGYDGVEAAVQELNDPAGFRRLLDDYSLDLVALVYTESPDHAEEFRRRTEFAAELGASKIVAHAGRDTMTFIKQIRFFLSALRVEERLGIPIGHETHRRRPFFSPMNTVALLRELPELHLNIDFSHWCCVTESLLEDHEAAIHMAAEHAVHLHGRVGYENGPQVPDPRIEEWQRARERHEAWWDLVTNRAKLRGDSTFTFVPEYGPPTYMHTDPATGAPVVDLWDICNWTADRFRQQFALLMAPAAAGAEI